MIELLTILVSAVGPAGLGSALKILAGVVDSWGAANEAREKREMIRELESRKLDHEFQTALFSNNGGRVNRRIALIIGMLTFAAVTILCTLYPSHAITTFTLPEQRQSYTLLWGFLSIPSDTPITVIISTGHITIMGMQMMSLMFGFYFTPGGRK